MHFSTFFSFLVISSFLLYGQAYSNEKMANHTEAKTANLSLDEVLKQARQATNQENKYDSQKALAEAKAFEGAYDVRVKAQVQKIHDRQPGSSPFSPYENNATDLELTIGQKLPTGAQWALILGKDKIDSLYSPTVLPPSRKIPNPENQLNGELQLSQDFWRDFLDPTNKALVEIKRSQAKQFQLQADLKQQAAQYEAERLYWSLNATTSELDLGQDLLDKAQEFVKQMKYRESLGRSDGVDTATAEVGLVNQESQVLKLEALSRQLLARLRGLLNTETLTLDHFKQEILVRDVSFPSDLKSLREKADNQRIDLKIIEQFKKIAEQKEKISRSESKPRLALFASAKLSGSQEKEKDSFQDLKKAKHPRYAVGIEFDYLLGGSKSAAELSAANFEKLAISEQEQQVKRDLKKDLDDTFAEITGLHKQVAAAQKRLDFFDAKVRQERSKLKQSRSESVVVLRYEMEVLTAKIEEISTIENYRSALAKFKFLSHSYPVSEVP